MEILKQIFPFSLNGPEFLILYLILMMIMLIIAYRNYSKNEKAQVQADIDNLQVSNVYELAYLRGGEQTFYELIISELVHEKRLTESNKEFLVNAYITIENPISLYLETLNKKTITLEQLFEVARTELIKIKEKFADIIGLRDSKILKSNLILLLCFELLGVIRFLQGIANDKPIGFLVALMLIGGIGVHIIHSWPIRKKVVEHYFNFNWDDMHVLTTPYQNNLLKYGFSSICVGTALYTLYPFFSSLNFQSGHFSNSCNDGCGSSCSSSCSSCSSSCGGGGCGGCGD